MDAPTSSDHPSVARFYEQLESVKRNTLPELRDGSERVRRAADEATAARTKLEKAADGFCADRERVAAAVEEPVSEPRRLLKRA